MKTLYIMTVGALFLAGCNPNAAPQQTARNQEMAKARKAAESVRFLENAEIDNIRKRLELTANPGLNGFIVLLNEAGQPIMYEGVRGKVTAGSKRLTPPMREWAVGGQGSNPLGPAPSDEGTWGNSEEYIFYWNTEGVYRQWNGKYLFSTQPIRLRTEPLVVSMEQKKD